MFQKKTHTKDPENIMREPYFALSNNAKKKGRPTNQQLIQTTLLPNNLIQQNKCTLFQP